MLPPLFSINVLQTMQRPMWEKREITYALHRSRRRQTPASRSLPQMAQTRLHRFQKSWEDRKWQGLSQ